MSKHARPSHNRRPAAIPSPRPVSRQQRLAEPEALLLDQIVAGALDPHPTAIAEAVRARAMLLRTVSSSKALAELTVGDRVRINRQATPRYLHGVEGTVTEVDDQAVVVCVHRPVGRFKTGEIRCPPLVLDRIPQLARESAAPGRSR
jgi:ribosomal protein L21E